MTTLEVPVRISAIDNLTGGLSNIVGHLSNVNAQFAKFGGLQQNMLRAVTAIPTMGFAGLVTAQQQELDKQARLFQAFGAASEEQRKSLSTLVNELAPKIGMRHAEMLKGATELVQAGLEPIDILTKNAGGVTFLERIGKAAIGANEKIEDLAIDLAQLAFIGKFPFETSQQKASTIERLAGIALAAPAFSPDKPRQHMMALSQFAPLLIPKMVGDNPTEEQAYNAMLQASALQNTLAFAFRGQLGGMGLKTILQRVMTPTVASQQQMMMGGFDYARVFGGINSSWATNPDPLLKSLLAGGIDASGERGWIGQQLANRGPDEDMLQFKGKFAADLTSRLGLKGTDRNMLKRGVDNFFSLSTGQFSITAFLEELSKMPPSALKDLAGLHHAPKAAVLQGAQALATYARILAGVTERAPTAIDTMSGIRNAPDSFDFQMRRIEAAGQTLKNAMWDSGTGAIITGAMGKISDMLVQLAASDPAKLQALSSSMILLAGAAGGITALGFAVGALRMALIPLGALLATPFGAGTLGALLESRRVNEMVDWSKAADAAKANGQPIPDLPSSAMPLIPRLWNWMSGMFSGQSSGGVPGITLGGIDGVDPSQRLGASPALMGVARAQLEGQGEVIIRIEQDGTARVMGLRSSGHIGLKTGDSMSDTPR